MEISQSELEGRYEGLGQNAVYFKTLDKLQELQEPKKVFEKRVKALEGVRQNLLKGDYEGPGTVLYQYAEQDDVPMQDAIREIIRDHAEGRPLRSYLRTGLYAACAINAYHALVLKLLRPSESQYATLILLCWVGLAAVCTVQAVVTYRANRPECRDLSQLLRRFEKASIADRKGQP